MAVETRELASMQPERSLRNILIGVGLAVGVCVFAMLTGFDRDRVFYPTLVAVNATYYILFAVIGRRSTVRSTRTDVFLNGFASTSGPVSPGVQEFG